MEIRYQSDRRKTFSYTIQPSGGQFFNEDLIFVRGDINYRLQPHFNLAIDARFDHIALPVPFSTKNLWLLGSRVDVTCNKSVFLATLVQYSSQQDNFSINSRVHWRFTPLSDLSLVYNDNYFTDTVFASRVRSLNLKVTYWLYL